MTASAPATPTVPEDLRQALERRTGADGFLPFDRFMAVALYGEGVGYYGRRASPFGPSGDFYTAPRVHPVFARTVARRVRALRGDLGPNHPFAVIDLGAGDGTLLAEITRALVSDGPAPTEAVAIDRSAERRAASRAAVEDASRGSGVAVHAVASLADLGPVVGVVIANELLDAQPVRRFRWDGATWTELGFRWEGGRPVPAGAPVRVPPPPPGLPEVGPEAAGLTVEISPAAEAMVREVADHLEAGGCLVIDFGAEQSELLAGQPRGTVAAVRGHRSTSDPTVAVGASDLSAFVNFTRVRAAARAAGLVELAYRSQAEALGAWGFEEELARALAEARTPEAEVRTRLAAKNLVFGFGTFRVLELAPAPGRANAVRLSDPS